MSLDIKALNLAQIYNKVFHYCKIFHRSASDASCLAAAEVRYQEVKKELK